MRRSVLLCLTLALVSACQGDDATRPNLDPASSPSALISDGAHSGGNPDFFFLPPLVRDPKTIGGVRNPLWNEGAANSSLTPTVRICELEVVATSAGKVATLPTDATPCKTGAYDVTTTLTAGNVSRGILDDTDIDNAVTRFLTHYSSFVEPYYHLGWKVPAAPIGTSTPPKFYRITVKVGTSKTLGILDVESVNNFTQLLNVKTNEFVPLTGGLRVPINFRIERYALCEVPGAATCTSVSGDISVAPLTVSTGVPDASGLGTTVGVTIPQQSTSTSTPLTVTISSCPNLNPSVIDLPTFGDCSRITTDPVLTEPLANSATVFVCAVGVNATLFGGLSPEQEKRVSLHRYDATGSRAGVVALPHANACTPGLPGGVASIKPSFGAMLAKLSHGEFKRAATEVIALMAPKPLYAAMFIDQGGGGLTDFFSDFQFALPSKMEIVSGTNNQTVPPGTTINPQVKVTDLGGVAVGGAKVHFFTADPGTSTGTVVVTGPDGLASVPWTIDAGPQSLSASGRGIASPSNNGPRGRTGEGDVIFDPFQPIQSPFDDFSGIPQETRLGTGSVTFTASGQTAQRLTVTGGGTGTGTVTSDPAGISCTITAGTGSGTCASDFAFGASVTLIATTSAGHGFTGFGGACSGGACTVVMSQPRSVTASFTLPPTQPGVISNGTVWFGILPFGNLNVPNGGPPSSGTRTTTLGLRYLPTNADAMSPGCPCEGWGVADATTGVKGFANASTGTAGIIGEQFTTTPTQVLSVVSIGSTFRVTHDFHPSAITPYLFEVTVSIQNISEAPVTDLRYRRVMDWDVEPTAFAEFVTIQGAATTPTLAYVSDNGFASADPLSARTPILFAGDAVASGPADHGTLFDFAFGPLAAGATKTFKLYYGAAGTEVEALGALRAIGAELYSLGQPNDGGTPRKVIDTPNTFMVGFTGVGGSPIIPALRSSSSMSRTPLARTESSSAAPGQTTGAPDPRNHPNP